jgi:hypothetical protein
MFMLRTHDPSVRAGKTDRAATVIVSEFLAFKNEVI